MTTNINPKDLSSFHQHLVQSKRILALCGAGLSAASGLPTFRGAGGLWRTHDAKRLASQGAWDRDAGLVWQFYNYRRHMALEAKPNAAHFALAELARKNPDFQCLTQNVDGLSQRADHPPGQLQLLHGTLFNVKCDNKYKCGYYCEDFNDPFCPALATPVIDPTSNAARARAADISDISVDIPSVQRSDLPSCPQCKAGVMRPGVVWFGESLNFDVTSSVQKFIDKREPIDLIMVIGTSAEVYPAAGYIEDARRPETRVAVVNMDPSDQDKVYLEEQDWYFQGDASQIVPQLLFPVTGEVSATERRR